MVFNRKDKEMQVIIATCNCGCNSELHIMHYTNDPDMPEEYYLSLHSSKWDEEQVGIFRLIGRRLKRAWYNLIGKDYLYMDIIFSKQEFNEFVQHLDNMSKTVKK